MSAPAEQPLPDAKATSEWAQIAAQAPQIADTLGRYLTQVGTFLAPRSVEAADAALRQLARWLLDGVGGATECKNDLPRTRSVR